MALAMRSKPCERKTAPDHLDLLCLEKDIAALSKALHRDSRDL